MHPLIEVGVYWQQETSLRADVDNILKPILDALIGVVYQDDKQVVGVTALCIPAEMPQLGGKPISYKMVGWFNLKRFKRIQEGEGFLIVIYADGAISSPP